MLPQRPRIVARPVLPLLALALTAMAPVLAREDPAILPVDLKSPDGKVTVRVEGSASGEPAYSVTFTGKPLIQGATLGMDLAPAGPLRHLRLTRVRTAKHDSTYAVFPGKTSRARDHYREAVLSLEEADGARRRIDLLFRAYDDGVAFRYRIPTQPALSALTVAAEHSTFVVEGNPTAYTLPVGGFRTPYEFYYQPGPVRSIPRETLIGLPLLLQYPDRTSLAITEADLTDYAGMYLSGTADRPGVLTSRLSPRLDDPKVAVKAALPHDTPWRVLMIGSEPGRLIDSNLVNNLNPPSVIQDTSWIKPGKTTFPWWNGYAARDVDFKPGLNTATMKHYLEFCAEQGIPYHSLDGLDNIAWYSGPIVPYQGADITRSLPGIDLPEVIAYATKKGVRLRLWMSTAAARAQMEKAFPVYEKWGIEGVMVDFVERDDQEMINYIRDMVALAARHHLTVTLHNISKPTGMTRTYPNLLTLESVYNLEFNKWDPKGSTPEHEVTVPFTRMLAGPLDYHSGSFGNVTEREFKPRNVAPVTIGTRARQLARYVVYEDYLPMVADYPEAYRGQPGLEFLVHVPTVWDETRTLNGEVGRYVTIARRSGRDWYVGSMSDSTARHLSIPLSFLGKGTFRAEVYADDTAHPDQPRNLLHSISEVRSGDTLRIPMAPAGGWVSRFTPVRR